MSHVLIGDGLIIAAQIIVALQMVIEEKFVNGKNIHPLRAVGWEGFFGACILSVLLVPFYYIILPENFCGAAYDPSIAPRCRLEDAIDGLYQERITFFVIRALLPSKLSHFDGDNAEGDNAKLSHFDGDNAKVIKLFCIYFL